MHLSSEARFARRLGVVLCVLAGGCERPGDETGAEPALETATTARAQPAASRPVAVHAAASEAAVTEELSARLGEADVVFVGEVVTVYRSHCLWSAVIQNVDYRVTRVIAGSGVTAGEQVRVAHQIVDESRAVDPERSALRAELVAPGAELVVLAGPRGLYLPIDLPPIPEERVFGDVSGDPMIAPATPERVAALTERAAALAEHRAVP
jgi:hypothetical protein